jgi:hypothetical protein
MAAFKTVYELTAALDRARIRWEMIGTYGTDQQRVMVRECDFPGGSDKLRLRTMLDAIEGWKQTTWARLDETDKGDVLFSLKGDRV